MHLKKYIIGQHCRMLKQCSTIKKLFVLHSKFFLYVNMQYFLERIHRKNQIINKNFKYVYINLSNALRMI